jgi:hypothetical protein
VALCLGRMDAGFDSTEVAGEGLAAAFVSLDPTGVRWANGFDGNCEPAWPLSRYALRAPLRPTAVR